MISASFPIIAVLTATVIQAGDLQCESARSVIKHFGDCIKANHISSLPGMFNRLMEGGVTTENDILEMINSVCSDESVREAYNNCTEMISTGCPDLRDIITTNVNKRFSFFCENGQPSLWIHDVLKNGYMFNMSCIRRNPAPVVGFMRDCVQAKDGSIRWTDIQFLEISYDEALPLVQKMVKELFYCTLDRANKELVDDTESKCGTTWEEVFLTCWLYHSAVGHLRPVIGRPEIKRLQELMLARAEES